VIDLLQMLSGGNLASDGQASDVADLVIKNPVLLDALINGLADPDDVIRARTAHAMERIARSHPEMVEGVFPQLITQALNDTIPMVRWHIAMIFGDLPNSDERLEPSLDTLYHLLADPSVFVKSWAIVSLAILGRKNPARRGEICQRLIALSTEKSKAIQNKVRKSLAILTDDRVTIPPGWIKTKD
jgi:HEAT repeat protein